MNAQSIYYSSGLRLPRIGVAAALLSLAACGGGGGDGEPAPTYFAVQGARNGSGLPVTVCITDTAYTDPATTQGQNIAQTLASYYGIGPSWRSFAGQGKTCREQFPTVDVLLSTDEYNRVVLPAVQAGGGGTPTGSTPGGGGAPVGTTPPGGGTTAPGGSTPTPGGSTTPGGTGTALPPPIPCPEGGGAGINGLTLAGTSRFAELTLAAGQDTTMLLDPGLVQYADPELTPESTTGTLRLRLWAVPRSYSGGDISGYVVSTYDVRFTDGSSQLRNGHSSDLNEHRLLAHTPPTGAYCMVLTLEQFDTRTCSDASRFCVSDWLQFPGSTSFR